MSSPSLPLRATAPPIPANGLTTKPTFINPVISVKKTKFTSLIIKPAAYSVKIRHF
jgi:hypothetical protein